MIRSWTEHARKLAFNVAAFCLIYAAGAFILVHLAAEGEL